jgi:GT2 family glycosyltransferase
MIAIVVPIHNGIALTTRCLQSLQRVEYVDRKTIVVDAGSTDDSPTIIRKEFPDVIVIPVADSLWWSGSTNAGVRHAIRLGADSVLLLNNDTIVNPDFLTVLTQTAQVNPGAVIASVVFFDDRPNIIRFAGGKLHWLRGGGEDALYRRNATELPSHAYETDWIGGMGVLVPIEVFRTIGFFDEEAFPHYAGDEDLWLRARKVGFRLLVEPRSRVWVCAHNTGLKLRQSSSLRAFVSTLFDRKFHGNIPTTLRFYIRHCPWYLLPISLPVWVCKNANLFLNRADTSIPVGPGRR